MEIESPNLFESSVGDLERRINLFEKNVDSLINRFEEGLKRESISAALERKRQILRFKHKGSNFFTSQFGNNSRPGTLIGNNGYVYLEEKVDFSEQIHIQKSVKPLTIYERGLKTPVITFYSTKSIQGYKNDWNICYVEEEVEKYKVVPTEDSSTQHITVRDTSTPRMWFDKNDIIYVYTWLKEVRAWYENVRFCKSHKRIHDEHLNPPKLQFTVDLGDKTKKRKRDSLGKAESSNRDPTEIPEKNDSLDNEDSIIPEETSYEFSQNSSQFTRASGDLFNASDPRIKNDILRIIGQYLDDNSFTYTKTVLYDEANLKKKQKNEYLSAVVNLRQAVLGGSVSPYGSRAIALLIILPNQQDGDWTEVDNLFSGSHLKTNKGIIYRVYKQQYLELVEEGEFQKAFSLLTKKIKPLERHENFTGEFRDLCYLLTAKSVQDAPSFKGWDGVVSARQKLADDLQSVLELEMGDWQSDNSHIPKNRLLELFYQAVAYQIETNRYQSGKNRTITTLLKDYEPIVIPNTLKNTFWGHTDNVKCVAFVGENGDYVASGSSDNTVKIWDIETGECVATCSGHTSKIWDICVDKSGSTMFSASGDKTIKIWSLKDIRNPTLVNTISECSNGDIYTVNLHPLESHLVFGGYDRSIKLYDLVVGRVVQSFNGHDLSVSSVCINPLGNLIVSGSKDHTVKFWDIMSGSVVNSITTHLGEVTSIMINKTSSSELLTSAKDNSNRLWDLRTLRPLCKYKGHQNTSKNFVKARFMHDDHLISSGNENGKVFIWNKMSGKVVSQLSGHESVVYDAVWNSKHGLLCSVGNDRTLKTWWYSPK
ncbi:hypothetical protein BB560_006816, partial [Smittium megazygosporum]